jgi:prolyl-tRNA editing enzyme YbaK/EbsC (Cys-tRNA(Pro) deacylase)
MRSSAQRVQQELDRLGFALKVVEMKESTRTSQEAADAVGCDVGQIAKSLVFQGKRTGHPVLVIASGANRVNEKSIRDYIGEPVTKPDAAYVLAQTGYVIGGIPPVGHKTDMACLIDEDLLQYAAIWAAAGTPYALFQLSPDQLVAMTRGRVVAVK